MKHFLFAMMAGFMPYFAHAEENQNTFVAEIRNYLGGVTAPAAKCHRAIIEVNSFLSN